ncbi:MAG: hypothetical protein HY719_10260 [Planctomycetes bacterium]|nr:hypothetical protein [Planctomycetota bacterium]
MPLASEEEVVRAVLTDKWDGQRLLPSLFVGEGISAPRPAAAVAVTSPRGAPRSSLPLSAHFPASIFARRPMAS